MNKPISTALALGRTLLLPLAGVQVNPEGTHGCAWGMINKAAPASYAQFHVRSICHMVDMPCDCKMGYVGGMVWSAIRRRSDFTTAVVHLFNQHVATEKDWTMDELIDWVRANEPEIPELAEPVTVSDKEVVHESL